MKTLHVCLSLTKQKSSQTKYIGITSDLRSRLKAHNAKKVPHTSKFAPWRIITATWFSDKDKAFKFERYLKHGSGHAFAKRHLF